MNERIRKLLTPKLEEWGGASGDNFSEELEKFAELIVRECISMIENEAGQYVEPTWAYELINDMNQHFGIE